MPEALRRITPEDLLCAQEYDAQRKLLKANLLPMKKLRRVEVGPFATFYFENYATMWLQVQEMLRIEKGGAEQIPGELEAYNPLIPQGDELIATLMLEIEDEKRRNAVLLTLGGIEETVFMEIGHDRVAATPTEYPTVRPPMARRLQSIGCASSSPRSRSPVSHASVSSLAWVTKITAIWPCLAKRRSQRWLRISLRV